MRLVELIAAILLPPLAVFLRQGIGPTFWVAVVLTLIGWMPGLVFAVVVLLKPDLLPSGWTQDRPSRV